MEPIRLSRVGSQLQRELALLLRNFDGGAGTMGFTVSGVKVSRDVKYADVWVSVLGSPDQIATFKATLRG